MQASIRDESRGNGETGGLSNCHRRDLEKTPKRDSIGHMAVARLNVALEGLRGKIGGWVFRGFGDIIEAYPAPDFSRRKPNAKQKASSKQFTLAVRYTDATLADPQQRPAIERRAKKLGLTPRSYLFKEYRRTHPQGKKRK